MKILFGDFNAKLERERQKAGEKERGERERIFSTRQLGMRVYIRIVKIVVLE
jgi:hypothetical protein